MPDDVPDYRTPSADLGHEAIRAPLAAAIDDLTAQIQRIDDAYLLLLSATDFAASTLRTVLAAQTAMASLTARVAALEAAAAPAPEPEPEPDVPPTDPTTEVAP